MKRWKKTAALSALLMTVSAAPALAGDAELPVEMPVDAIPISAPADVLPILAPDEARNFLRLVGVVEWVDLEGGYWAVAGMRLIGDQDEFEKLAGQEVVVEGTEFTGISIQMVPAIEVMSIRPAGEVEAMAPVLWDVGADAPVPKEIRVYGEPVSGDLGGPVVADGVLFVPLRAIAEAMGAEVTWDGEQRQVQVDLPDRTVIFHIGLQEAEVLDAAAKSDDSSRVAMAQPAQIIGDRTMISADAITTVLGLRQTEAEEGVMNLVSGAVTHVNVPEELTAPDEAMQGERLVGTISQVEDGRFLLEGPLMSNGDPMLIWLTISDETQITVGEGAGTAADLEVGREVVVELSGPILESYPAQGGAASILVMPAPKADILTGVIKEIADGRILLEGAPMASGEPFLAWLAVGEETPITVGDAEGTLEDLKVGVRVEVELSGPMLMSYPAQGGANAVRVLPATEVEPGDAETAPDEGKVSGTITEVGDDRILVKGGEFPLYLIIGEETEIVKRTADAEEAATAADLQLGLQVEAFYSGPMLKSYPGRVGADKIVILAERPAQLFRGEIEEMEEGRILVAGAPMENGEPERLYLFITEETRIVKVVDGAEEPATAADLAVGQQVEAVYSGPMLLSYPGQVGADTVRILK